MTVGPDGVDIEDVRQAHLAYAELEAAASETPGIEFVSLRYGFFYGPGTWYSREGDMGEQARQQQIPIIGKGEGVASFVHIDDAAAATAAALECAPGAYNVVDGDPTPQISWLPAFARDQRSYLTVAVGCTGGQHRSVYFVETLAAQFRDRAATLVRHRELDARD